MSLTDDIRRTFEKASLQHEAAKGLNAEDWARYRDIQTAHDDRQRQEREEYFREYTTRVEAARKQLIDKAASKDRAFLPLFLGRDGFNRAEIDRPAHRVVQSAHHRPLAKMELEASSLRSSST